MCTLRRPSTRELELTRVVDAPIELVWEAWTNPEHLPRWLSGPAGSGDWAMTTCEVDLRPGGAWRLGWRRSDGEELGIRGVYDEVRYPERLASTSSWGGEWPDTLETLVLDRVGTGRGCRRPRGTSRRTRWTRRWGVG